jgi:carboxyl-terminal processing protease
VLIDSGSASMAEVFASAVQEDGAARVFGTTSAGSVAAGQMFPLSDGSAIQITVWELLSGNGTALNRVGVVPDETIAPGPGGVQDPVVLRATEWLHETIANNVDEGATSLAPAA